MPLDRTALIVSSVVGLLLSLSGGSLVLKNPARPRVIHEDDE
jgi:hypothetical protein